MKILSFLFKAVSQASHVQVCDPPAAGCGLRGEGGPGSLSSHADSQLSRGPLFRGSASVRVVRAPSLLRPDVCPSSTPCWHPPASSLESRRGISQFLRCSLCLTDLRVRSVLRDGSDLSPFTTMNIVVSSVDYVDFQLRTVKSLCTSILF